MLVNGKHYRTIWLNRPDPPVVNIIDQRLLPHQFVIEELQSFDDMVTAICQMKLRGAGLIGAAAAYGMYLAVVEGKEKKDFDRHLKESAEKLVSTRPTAANLAWAVDRQIKAVTGMRSIDEKISAARVTAEMIADEDAKFCNQIGVHGLAIIEDLYKKKNDVVNILTHCNAGWLAFVDYGSATAPIYNAFEKGIPVHVWVDETRPRNQGASLTAWELSNMDIPHTIITDNTGGHLMQKGKVDMVITGADRVTRKGDAANKIGTYLKALAAKDNDVPFYVAFPSSTFDWQISDGLSEIEIEERSADEIKYMSGWCDNSIKQVLITPATSAALNYGFDVTPSRLITALVTERGICTPSEKEILKLFPEKAL